MEPSSFRVEHFSKKENEEELRTNLDLIEELREQAQVWGNELNRCPNIQIQEDGIYLLIE